jgi:prepilin-type N-terminal cleavage/methylation domain-containing protein
MTALRQLRRDEAGFTLTEMLVVMLLFGIIGTGITSVMLSTARTQRYQTQLSDSISQARVATERMRKELRGARQIYPQLPAGVPSNATRVSFWRDANFDDLAQPAEQITYELVTVSGVGTLQRFTAASATPIPVATGLNVGASSFSYDGAAVAPDDTSVFRVVLTTASVPGGPAGLVFTETIELRNVVA